ncbi:hypothetical protein A8U91_00893 [Halomonas elongata]|nr:hypothetical protein A8U91_00893 [Halomonas elongata]
MMLGDDRAVHATWANGACVHQRDITSQAAAVAS